jgi:hypothetical protein
MAPLDPLFRAVESLLDLSLGVRKQGDDFVVTSEEADLDQETIDQLKEADPDEQLEILRTIDRRETNVEALAESIFGGTFDTLEDEIDEELTERDLTEAGNAEKSLNDAEGTALAEATAVIGAQTFLESLSLGQVDSFETPVAEILSFLALDDLVGTRVGVTMEQAVLPALEADINAQNRTKFADLQDVIEANLRNKDSDTGWTEDLATYGIREDDVEILEEVALEQIEFEELLETPAELGKVVPQEVVEAELDRAGYAEETKEFLAETADLLPESARTYQELLRTEALVQSLDTLATDGVVSPEEALDTIPDDVEANDQAFLDRFALLRDLPAGAPSGTDFEGAFASGYLDLEEFRARWTRPTMIPRSIPRSSGNRSWTNWTETSRPPSASAR